ncbi:MAG TPA: 3-deoxy-8-phosphooctulonate synthase [Thermoanaerobaculales bacterium]|nr:3-deoxy-8-phosphooctulonate synthase [Thermoanaerobaculales bacterium]HPA81891.1 3-deoxy-8-phosphooctulonate synthase [Thermoanaerobaculales bacterium]HQL29998.1 3-deoxy-8-phosphooctulonate synthase [Thermoanaerobaculales bacterium]HQP43222.1 3-deoxy-8-phosphooctulonate synthase [Thermoanaerobaculales bacterium]
MVAAPFQIAPGIPIGGGSRPVYIAGPCVIESEAATVELASRLAAIAAHRALPLLFKASFDKANRSSLTSFRGPGIDEGLAILRRVKEETGLPVLTDVHEPGQADRAAAVADVLQVPAFLCRQTDLLLACGGSGAAVNIKKGQFMAPDDMANAVDKVRSTGNERVTVTERGTSFGYHNLVVDMRAFPMIRRFAPVVFDVTHSLQLPGGLGLTTGGTREFHPQLARAAAAAGVDGFFIEVHPSPHDALSDASTQLSLEEFDTLVEQLEAVTAAVRGAAP